MSIWTRLFSGNAAPKFPLESHPVPAVEKPSREWPFSDPKNVLAFTVADIVAKRAPILLVSHEEEDGGWQFLTGGALPPQEEWKLVALSAIVALDPSVELLADLPIGYSASRAGVGEPWQRSKSASDSG